MLHWDALGKSLHSISWSEWLSFTLGHWYLPHMTRKWSRALSINQERVGGSPRVCLHSQCQSLHLHPVIILTLILVPPQSPTSYVWQANSPTCRGYSNLWNIHDQMGNPKEQTSASCTLYSTRAQLSRQILFEDGLHKGLHHQNVYVYHLVRVFPLANNFSVVNPSVQMSWIMHNWQKEWYDDAVNIIQGLVSIVFDFMRYFIANTCSLDGGILGTQWSHCHLSCRASGWSDECLADGKGTFAGKATQRSVKEEYSIYVMGALSAGLTFNMLGFWKVKFLQIHYNICSYKLSTDAWAYISNNLLHHHGLLAHISICCPMWKGVFFKLGDRYKEEEQNKAGVDGGSSNT